ncbi:MAG: hypothetical protein PHH54_06295 [Candidatus Nanoarchaeia archaeon]|nr:hypothetical protein [Candidatus Nanoarchaeia archaeon]
MNRKIFSLITIVMLVVGGIAFAGHHEELSTFAGVNGDQSIKGCGTAGMDASILSGQIDTPFLTAQGGIAEIDLCIMGKGKLKQAGCAIVENEIDKCRLEKETLASAGGGQEIKGCGAAEASYGAASMQIETPCLTAQGGIAETDQLMTGAGKLEQGGGATVENEIDKCRTEIEQSACAGGGQSIRGNGGAEASYGAAAGQVETPFLTAQAGAAETDQLMIGTGCLEQGAGIHLENEIDSRGFEAEQSVCGSNNQRAYGEAVMANSLSGCAAQVQTPCLTAQVANVNSSSFMAGSGCLSSSTNISVSNRIESNGGPK